MITETQTQEATTEVIFRVWRANPKTVIALFPYEIADARGLYCSSYEHIGQHGGADYNGVIAATRPATADEYSSLKSELESYPYTYRLKVIQKAQYKKISRAREAMFKLNRQITN